MPSDEQAAQIERDAAYLYLLEHRPGWKQCAGYAGRWCIVLLPEISPHRLCQGCRRLRDGR